MDATLVLDRPGAAPRSGVGPRVGVGRAVVALRGRAGRVSTRQRVAASVAFALALLAVVGIAAGPRVTGYLGVFGFSVMTNAILFLPSGRGAVMVAGAMVLNPLAVAVLAGLGGALGEVTGYALGRSTRRLVGHGPVPAWLVRGAQRHMALTVLAVSIVPSPFVDAIGIIAGRTGYPLGRFVAYSAIGKVLQSIGFVYLAIWNLSLLTSWLGMEA